MQLHKLAGIIKKPTTPAYRTPGLSSASASRLNIRTPATVARTPRPDTVARPQTARRGKPTTPHAIHAFQQRKNAATPGFGRRKSVIKRRETPRDILRELSKKLAPVSLPIEPSPQVTQRTPQSIRVFEDVDEGPTSAPPRLSIAFDEEDDSWHLAPPRLSEIPADDKENYTLQSIEGKRDKRLSRSSLDSIRASQLFGKLGHEEGNDDSEIEDDEDDASVALDDVTKRTLADGDNTQEFRALINASRRQSRPSDLGIQSSPGASVQDETFQFRFAEKPRNSIAPGLFEEPSYITTAEDDLTHGEVQIADDPLLFDADVNENDDEEQQAAIDSMIDEATAFLDSAFDVSLSPGVRQGLLSHDVLSAPAVSTQRQASSSRRTLKASKHGIEYPSLPLPVIKRLATSFARSTGALSAKGNLGKDVLLEIERASDWFFEQMSEDSAAYAQHAGRKQIKEDDVIGVMKRQRVLDDRNTVFSLAQKLLSRELIQEIRMPPVKKAGRVTKRKRKAMDTIQEEDSTLIE